jgi:hypothetical protein
MKALLCSFAIALAAIAGTAVAATPAAAPAGSTGQCKDGSYTSAAGKKGACRGHKGVQTWYAEDASASSTTSSTATKATPAADATSKKSDASESTVAAPASAPAGSTGLCNDGSYSIAAKKQGACRGHKGVKDWYGVSASSTAPSIPGLTTTKTPPAKSASSTMPASSAPAASGAMKSATPAATKAPAPGGGAGKVWVNTSTKVYHCAGDRFYGTTKDGEYMSESDAVAKGARAAHGKKCSE